MTVVWNNGDLEVPAVRHQENRSPGNADDDGKRVDLSASLSRFELATSGGAVVQRAGGERRTMNPLADSASRQATHRYQ